MYLLTHKKMYLFFLLALTALNSLNAMQSANLTPFKRSKFENNQLGARGETKAQYNAGLDKALQEIAEDGSTILHTAIAQGNIALCCDLLSRGADPLVQNKKGQSALHLAVEYNNHVIAEQLKAGMPKMAKKERLFAALCGLHRFRMPRDIRRKVLSNLPELIIAYPSFCRSLISSEIITLTQLSTAYAEPLRTLLNAKDSTGITAYMMAKNRRNGFMARMTKPLGIEDVCKEEIIKLLYGTQKTETKEN